MNDGSEKRNHQFEFHDSHVFEKRSNSSALANRMSLCRKHGFTLVDKVHYLIDCKTVRIFAYSSTREQSNKRCGTRLKTESETGERR